MRTLIVTLPATVPLDKAILRGVAEETPRHGLPSPSSIFVAHQAERDMRRGDGFRLASTNGHHALIELQEPLRGYFDYFELSAGRAQDSSSWDASLSPGSPRPACELASASKAVASTGSRCSRWNPDRNYRVVQRMYGRHNLSSPLHCEALATNRPTGFPSGWRGLVGSAIRQAESAIRQHC